VRADEKLTAFVQLEAVTTMSLMMITTRSGWFSGRQFLHSKRQKCGAGKWSSSYQSHVQYLILLTVISMMVLYMLIIVGCLCYVGRHGRRTS
jgi:hypothetical protein